jgi:hypothetical protein
MTIKELLDEYLDGKVTAIKAIRRLSGIFTPNTAVDTLALICSITRVEEGDLDKETFKEVWMERAHSPGKKDDNTIGTKS